MKHAALFTPIDMGRITLKNRIVLPPLTRQRSAQPGDIATDLMATYYHQRASAGFMVSEGTQIEPRGQGYAWTPGIYSQAQIDGWRKVTEAVHAEGGVIFAQLWHVGRVSHNALQPDGQYAQAARNAIDAGFDGVEIHAANGYLVNQFISAHSNQRDDAYGGSLENRLRFLREIVDAVAAAVGADRLGVRFTPLFTGTDQDRVYIGLVEEDPHTTYIEAIKVLEAAGVAYVSIAEADWDNAPDLPESFRRDVRANFSGKILYAGRYTAERGERLIEAGLADLIAFGRPFIANPDLPERIANGWPLNPLDPATVYGGAAKGLTDYPTYTD